MLHQIDKMNAQDTINYQRITEAIDYIQTHFKSQPSLEEVAENVHLSPFHFQRLFKEWVGTSPKKFLQFISIEYAKKMLKEKQMTLFETASETGLSGTSRLHDLFIKIEGMTPAEFKNGGQNLAINYSFSLTPFGDILIASTAKGICYLVFIEDKELALSELYNQFPNAFFKQNFDVNQQNALHIFRLDWEQLKPIKLHLNGSGFQLKVWESLLKIPMGCLTTYGSIAKLVDQPKAARAIGSAIGSNPIAFLIPCHRVIQATGKLGGYRWGINRKSALIGWEAAKINDHLNIDF